MDVTNQLLLHAACAAFMQQYIGGVLALHLGH